MSGMVVRELQPLDASALAVLFERLAADQATRRFFHPHPLDGGNAQRVSAHRGLDVYLGCFEEGRAIGYAMLRGWDEGFDVPSFGVATDPDHRRQGIGAVMMRRALDIAAKRGARQVLLHVHADNAVARLWYEAAGFRADGSADDGQLLYRLSVHPASA